MTRFIVTRTGVTTAKVGVRLRPLELLKRLVVPPVPLHPHYKPYSWWTATAALCGSGLFTLGMQSMLTVLSYPSSNPTSSTTCMGIIGAWLVKEALGQVGGVLGMSSMFRLPDMNAKLGRMLANGLLNMASIIELTTPFWMPAAQCNAQASWWWFAFVALSLGTGVTRNLGMMISSAARAHQLTSLSPNRAAVIGQLTGAAAMQTTLSGVLGSFAVVVANAFFDLNAFRLVVILSGCGLYGLSLYATRQACRFAWSPSPTRYQIETLVSMFRSGLRLSPTQFSLIEPILHRQRIPVALEPYKLTEKTSRADLLKAKERGWLSTDHGIWLVQGHSTRRHLEGIFAVNGLDAKVLKELDALGWLLDEANLTSDVSISIIEE